MFLVASILLPLNSVFGARQCRIKCSDPCPFHTWSEDDCKDYCDGSPNIDDWCEYREMDRKVPGKGGSCFARYRECIEIPDEIPIAPGAIYRYYYPGDSQDHICTVAPNELGTGSIDGYRFEGILGYAETTQKPGTIPLYRYVNDGKNDHLLASNWNELGEGCCGYKLEGIIGYVYTQQENGTVPIRRYFSGRGHDHMCSTDPNEFGEGREGYKREGIVGYIWTKPPSKR
jgi:hypothetical protein